MATKTTTKKTGTKTVDKKTTKTAPKKQPKISVNAFEKVVKDSPNTKAIKWNDLEIIITPSLSLKDMMKFVSNVVSLCFVGDDNKYTPEVKDFAVKANVLEMYSNITLPKNIERQYEFIYCTDVFETILMNVNPHQFQEMMVAIDKKLDHMASSSVADAERRMNNILSTVEDLGAQLESVFNGIDAETMTSLVQAMQNGKLDEGKLMKEYFANKPNMELVETSDTSEGDTVD